MDWNRVEGNWKQVKGKVKEIRRRLRRSAPEPTFGGRLRVQVRSVDRRWRQADGKAMTVVSLDMAYRSFRGGSGRL